MDYRKKTVVASVAGLTLEGMDIMFISFAMTMIIAEFNIDLATGGLISSITNIGMLLGGIIFGVLADKYGRVKVFTYTIILFAIGTALTGVATSIEQVYVYRFIAGLGAGGEYGIGMALVAEAWPKNKQGRASSYVSVGAQYGVILAALLSAIILPTLGWRALFFVGVLPVIFAFIVRKNLHESPEWLASQNNQSNKEKKGKLAQLFATPRVTMTTLTLILMATVQIAGYNGLMIWLPSMLQKSQGLSVSSSALWTISTAVGMIIGMLTFGRFMDRFGAKRAFGIFLLASACAVFLYSFATGAVAILMGGAIVGFFSNGMFAGYGALISSFYPVQIRSTATNTIFNFGRAIGGFSPIFVGYILQSYDMTVVMIYLAALYGISFMVMLTLKGSTEDLQKA
ncbi:MFS transporter [Lysinibacillus sp. FSL M8-0216]|uniref:Predicted arabinose efflux permease, MFS family n=1 Tax=Lysinibacillus fusiformis TaxID=28031 RepID=A0A1H9P8K9_9BACI|nr:MULTISPECIES: MFS transporter [Lysinibacillus]EAZ87829.1 major facilitator superfamily permease [Bacillus sp. B14905]MED4075431.1 MFS transporter [Lysinibacillus fusiformis]MED4671863.1 MFS transporter [Lysinibacillus fusiformis]PCD81354.1 MFS transporter [Lysinibacillus fusiformis]QAS57512.1 MFS transporter [Lysinibacillus sphaericus]